jgi:hypothetical protein
LQTSDASYAAIFASGLARSALPFVLFAAAVAIVALTVFGGVRKGRPVVSGAGFALLCVAGSMLWTSTLRPEEAGTRSLATFAAEVHRQVGGSPVYVAYEDPEFAWYYGLGVSALPGEIARSGPKSGVKVYLVARPRELGRIAPAVRRNSQVVVQSYVLGGGGPPALYEITAETSR